MPSLKAEKKELTAAEIKPLVEKEGEKLPAPISLKNLYQLSSTNDRMTDHRRGSIKPGKGSTVCRVGRKGAG